LGPILRQHREHVSTLDRCGRPPNPLSCYSTGELKSGDGLTTLGNPSVRSTHNGKVFARIDDYRREHRETGLSLFASEPHRGCFALLASPTGSKGANDGQTRGRRSLLANDFLTTLLGTLSPMVPFSRGVPTTDADTIRYPKKRSDIRMG
jgi:hypothetical protein